jgi:hypothetical protein
VQVVLLSFVVLVTLAQVEEGVLALMVLVNMFVAPAVFGTVAAEGEWAY